MFRTGKSIDTESRFSVCLVLVAWRNWGVMATGCGASFGSNENVLKLTGDRCRTLWNQWIVHLKLVDYTVYEYFNKGV